MASGMFAKAKEDLLGGLLDLDTDDIRVALIDSLYTVNVSTHEDMADVTNITAQGSAAIGSRTLTAGTFDGADYTITGVTGDVDFLIIYKHTGTPSGDRLIAYIDNAGSAFGVTASSSDVTIAWDAAGIFTL